MAPKCHLCQSEKLSLQKVHRFSGPAVICGYIIAAFAGFGMILALIFGALTLAASNSTANQTISPTLPNGTPKTQQQMDMEKSAQHAAAGVCGVGGVFGAICLFLASFMGGLLGYILIMKKRVLLCAECGGHTDYSG